MAGAWWESHPRGVYAARARGIEGASRPPCEARDLGTAAPERFWHKNRQWERTRLPRRLRARHGAPPRVQAFRGHCMCMLWYEGSGRAVRPRRGHKFFGFCCSARRAAPHHPQPCNDITPTGAWREHATRGARGASLPWLGAPHAGWPAPGAAAHNDDAPRPVYVYARRVKHEDRAKRGTHLREVVDLIGGRRRGRSAGAAQPSESQTLLLCCPFEF